MGLIMARMKVINAIVHTASLAAAGAGAGLAQAPGSDSAIIIPIQVTMILAIAGEHGHRIDRSAALPIISTQAATMVGRKVSQFLVGWIPGAGNAVNAGTAAAITEAIGWTAHRFYRGLNNDG